MSIDLSSTYQENHIKVILLGNAGVGKTNLINVAMRRKFELNTASTMSQNFSRKFVEYNGMKYTLEIWDTIGQEKLRSINKLFYKNSKIVIFVYDITKLDSYNDLQMWAKEIDTELGLENVIKGVVGNKIDLFLEEKVPDTDGEKYAESIGADFLRTSAKCDDPEIFNKYLINLFEKYIKINSDNKSNKKRGISLDYSTTFKKKDKSKTCC